MVTPVCTDLAELRAHLVALRRAAADAAQNAGARLVAVGATPVRESHRTVPDEPRYHAMSRRFGPVAHDPAVCGCHVHVGLPDRELAVQVCNHLRPWLPIVQALTANSPLHDGADTGHASWRSLQLQRWPCRCSGAAVAYLPASGGPLASRARGAGRPADRPALRRIATGLGTRGGTAHQGRTGAGVRLRMMRYTLASLHG
ncbi:Protein of unknown function [Micromonospora lupini str. Lupac 08]|uniref:Glutamate--cysteine ligase n=1 Tax=Micromonospora lupini str. Lupac 08 TaxID=1150864 RepID=I0L7N3_9ACTN|nr:Protein of unknown function [Micromonospora lupini str. Lupac 08]